MRHYFAAACRDTSNSSVTQSASFCWVQPRSTWTIDTAAFVAVGFFFDLLFFWNYNGIFFIIIIFFLRFRIIIIIIFFLIVLQTCTQTVRKTNKKPKIRKKLPWFHTRGSDPFHTDDRTPRHRFRRNVHLQFHPSDPRRKNVRSCRNVDQHFHHKVYRSHQHNSIFRLLCPTNSTQKVRKKKQNTK